MRKMGRPRKSPGGETEGTMTQLEIMKRYRERLKSEGKDQVSYWLDAELIERIKKSAQETGKTTSEMVNEALLKAFKND